MSEHEPHISVMAHVENEAALRNAEGVRITDRVEFVVPHELGLVGDAGPHAELDPNEQRARFAELVRSELFGGEELPGDFSVRPTGIGRGADGPAVLLELLGTAAGPATVVAGGVLTWLTFSGKVVEAWRFLRRRMPGGNIPVLSLGTIKYLCTYDLNRRLGGLDNVSLLAAEDVTRHVVGDLGYTGEDLYAVIFTRRQDVFVYIVDSVGQVVHFGNGFQRPHRHLRFIGDGVVSPGAPAAPGHMLCEDDGEDER